MTKIISLTPSSKDFGNTGINKENTQTFNVANAGTEKLSFSGLVSDSVYYRTETESETIQPDFPANSTIYLNDKGKYQDLTTGAFYTTNQGYGIAGTTDANGLLTLNSAVPSVSITNPSALSEYEIDEEVTINWTASNVTHIDIVVESGSGLLEITDIDATLGTYSFNLTAGTGTFYANDSISISIVSTLNPLVADTVNIVSIATITITPAIGDRTAGVAFNVAGTTNLPDGAEVEVFAGATSKGIATVASGAFTKSVTIADPVNDVIIKVQDKLNANANDTEEIDVASGTINIENFESYTIDNTISDTSWQSYSTMDLYCKGDGSGGKCGALVTSTFSAYSGSRTKTFSSAAISGKKLKFRMKYAKEYYDSQLKITIGSWDSGWITLSGYAQDTWHNLEFTHGLSSATSIKFEIQNFMAYTGGYYIYVDDIKFE